jgi:UDPglucose 6-dehydrogenase
LCDHFGIPEVASYWESVVKMNDWQKSRFARRIVKALNNTAADKQIAVFGFAFKKDTNDTRESAAIAICRQLLTERARVVVYDPKVPAEGIRLEILGPGAADEPNLTVASSAYAAAAGSHAVAVVTEWDEFKALDFEKIYASMEKPASLFDGRNILDLKRLAAIGFRTHAIGK